MTFPILEFDPAPNAIIEPSADVPEHLRGSERCVITFFKDVLHKLEQQGLLKSVHTFRWELGPNPIYQMEWGGQSVWVIHPGVGAPLGAGYLEEMIALGIRKFTACGGVGVLDPEIVLGHAVVLTSAVRDEGTSYHYLPPGREVSPDAAATGALVRACERRGVPYRLGKTWTTDAPYRETVNKIARRRAEGCLVVEMESAALIAVSQFRGAIFGQALYGGDDLSGTDWDHRDWTSRSEIRESLFWLCAEACIRL